MLGVYRTGAGASLSIYADGEGVYAIKSCGIAGYFLRRRETWLKSLPDGEEFISYTEKNEGVERSFRRQSGRAGHTTVSSNGTASGKRPGLPHETHGKKYCQMRGWDA
jgi:hypothetical protein